MQKKILGIIGSSVFIANPLLSQTTSSNLTTQELSGRINTITTAVPFFINCPDSRNGGNGRSWSGKSC